MVKEYTSDSLEKTKKIGFDFCLNLKEKGPLIIPLLGDLGSGKTTFMKGVGEFFGIKEDIISPTFLIQRNYNIKKNNENFENLIHIDAYRIEDEKELKTIAWDRFSSDPKNIIFVEWPEKLGINLDTKFKIEFFYEEENTRKILIHKND